MSDMNNASDSEFLAWAKDRYGSLTGPERDRLFALATRAGFALEAENERLRAEVARLAAENERLRAEVQKLESECTDLATDLSTQRQDNASLAEPWKVVNPLQAEAARLAAENEKLRAALEPFASMGKAVMGRKHHNEAVISYALAPTVKIHHFVAAHLHVAALQDKSDTSPEGKAASEGAESRK